jgi:hypothetical protein
MSCSKHTNFSTNSPQDLNSNSRFKIKRRNKAGNKNRKKWTASTWVVFFSEAQLAMRPS